jgi:hypothetical protein
LGCGFVIFGGSFENGDNGQNHERLRKNQKSPGQIDLIKESRAQACAERSEIQGKDRLGIGKAVPFQAVREMLRVADKGTFALAYPKQCHADEIVEGNGHDYGGQQDRIPLAALRFVVIGGAEGQQGDEKADHERAGVTHKDFGRREIEYEKAEQGAKKNEGEAAYENLAGYNSGDEQNQTRYRGNTGGQAVHIVKEVKGVDNQDYPKSRKQGRDYSAFYEKLDADFRKGRGGYRNCELDGKFGKRPQMLLVIPKADYKQNKCAQHDDHKLTDFAQEISWVNVDVFDKPTEAAGDKQKPYG